MSRDGGAARLPVALDAMGGDNAPEAIVHGAIAAVTRLPGLRVTLVGRADVIQRAVRTAPGVSRLHAQRMDIVDAPDVIGMAEHAAAAVRSKPDSSLVRACRLVAEGRARGVVSAGNSGAMLAAALFTVGRIRGVARPAIGASLPNPRGSTFVLDVGANADCRAEWLAQFGVMGSVYARTMLGVAEPRVALLSNGEEREKGSQLVQAAAELLAEAPVRFTGNVEGKDLFADSCDVAVTDGFTGNVALKTAEGVAEFLLSSIATAARSSRSGMVGGALLRPKLRPLRDRVDYRRTGGALLLGVAGEVVIAHGRSDSEAIVNALRVALDASERDVSGTIARAIAETAPKRRPAARAGEAAAASATATAAPAATDVEAAAAPGAPAEPAAAEPATPTGETTAAAPPTATSAVTPAAPQPSPPAETAPPGAEAALEHLEHDAAAESAAAQAPPPAASPARRVPPVAPSQPPGVRRVRRRTARPSPPDSKDQRNR